MEKTRDEKMILVVDTNVIIAAIIKPSVTQNLILKEELELYSPEFLRDEIEKHKSTILKKTGYTKEIFETVVSIIYSNIKIISSKKYKYLKKEILKFTPDEKDWPFLALAKHLDASLWSNDSELKKQNKIKIITTEDLILKLKSQ